MNQTFKVVFNKARGAFMVVNEVTSCVQAKGTKTVIAATLTVVAGAAFAADFPDAVHDMNNVVFEGPVEETFENDSGLKAFVLPGDDGKASITNSTVKNVTLTLQETGGNPNAAILISRGSAEKNNSATVSGSTFENINLISNGKSGNGVHGSVIGTNWTDITLDGTTFRKNSSTSDTEQVQGGALYMSMGKLHSEGSSFESNTASSIYAFGGGAALFGVDAEIKEATFNGNMADSGDAEDGYALGGALYLRGAVWGGPAGKATAASVAGSSFLNNKALGADGEGGAVYVKGDDGYSMAYTSSGNTYTGNQASNFGGALYTLNTSTTSSGDTFSDNSAKNGGAIYADSNTDLKIVGSTLTSNAASRDGGAIAISDLYSKNAWNVTIENSVFTDNNSARKGGAVTVYDMEGHQYANVTMTNVTFTDNHTTGDAATSTGGAIHSESDLTVKGNSVFTGNTASGKGGAIYLGETDAAKQQGNTASLTLSAGENETIHFADNKAGDKANDIYLASGTSSTFEGQGRIELMSGLAGEGTVTSSAANVYVEDVTGFTGDLTISDGVFSVNGAAFIDTDNQVFGEGANITIENEGTLNLANVTHAGKITLTDGTVTDDGAITFDNKFLAGSVDGGVLTVTTNNDLIGNSGFGSDSQEVQDNLNALFARGLSARESDIMTRISQQYADGNVLSGEGVEAFRQATGGSVTAGAFNVAYDAQTQFTDSIVRHQIREHNGYGVWADVYYTSNEAKTLYGSSGYETDIYGGVFGFDATFSCGATAGIAVTVGTGDTDTVGELRSNLDTDFYGIALYTSKDFGGLDTKLDVGYMKFDNDFSGLGDAGDVDAWTVGLRGDFKAYQGEVMSITPHVGVRYSHFESDAVAFNDKTTLNVFETPVGVAFNGNFETAGWKIVPTLDFSIVPQLGDKDVDTFAGNVDVIDNLYNTTLGVAATYQNLTFGLDYRYGFGNEERSNNAVNLKVRYSF